MFDVLSMSAIVIQQKIVSFKFFKKFHVWVNFLLLSSENIAKLYSMPYLRFEKKHLELTLVNPWWFTYLIFLTSKCPTLRKLQSKLNLMSYNIFLSSFQLLMLRIISIYVKYIFICMKLQIHTFNVTYNIFV